MARRLFLERRTYRLSRLQDAARLLPILGLILIFGPIFIRDDTDAGGTVGGRLIYYLAVWLVLIVLTALISRSLASGPTSEADVPDPSDEATKPVPATKTQA